MTSLVDRLLPDALWQRIQPLLPAHHPPTRRGFAPRPGPQLRRRIPLHGPHLHPWSLLPAKELGCGPATTCWRLDEWGPRRGFDQFQMLLLDELGETGRIDLKRVSVDSFSLRAVKGGADRRKPSRSG